jgi:hypothetical protein
MDPMEKAEIQIPGRNLESEEALSNLVFEIFNVQVAPNMRKMHLLAERGDISMLDYAFSVETEEFKSKEGYDALIKKCTRIFDIAPEPGKPDLETQLWNHEINCHTDKIRMRWIDFAQPQYCKKHPKDNTSCHIKNQICAIYTQFTSFLNRKRMP